MKLSKFELEGELIDIADNWAREHIPTKTSELDNDSGFIDSSSLSTVALTGDYDDLINKPTIPTKTSELDNDSGFTTFSGDYDDLTDKPTIPNVSASYSSPFNKLRLGDKAIVYGTTSSQSVSCTNVYNSVAYYADVTINIPSAVRLSAVGCVNVQSLNGLGLVSIDVLSVTTSDISIRVYSPVSETINMQFLVEMIGDN